MNIAACLSIASLSMLDAYNTQALPLINELVIQRWITTKQLLSIIKILSLKSGLIPSLFYHVYIFCIRFFITVGLKEASVIICCKKAMYLTHMTDFMLIPAEIYATRIAASRPLSGGGC